MTLWVRHNSIFSYCLYQIWKKSAQQNKRGTFQSLRLQNLICCLGILLQIDGFTPYTTTAFCTVHIQIHSYHWLIYKTFVFYYVHVFMSVQCQLFFFFFLNKHVTKKFFKLAKSGSDPTEMNLNKEATDTVSSVVDCTACRRSKLLWEGWVGVACGNGEGPDVSSLWMRGISVCPLSV